MKELTFSNWFLQFQYIFINFMVQIEYMKLVKFAKFPQSPDTDSIDSKIICISMWSCISHYFRWTLTWSHSLRKHRCPTTSCLIAHNSKSSFHYGKGKILCVFKQLLSRIIVILEGKYIITVFFEMPHWKLSGKSLSGCWSMLGQHWLKTNCWIRRTNLSRCSTSSVSKWLR